MPRAQSLHNHAFTLIELLVSLAILVVLVSLLAPSLGSARESARTSLCASNLRQLQIANDLYAPEFADHFAPGAAGFRQNLSRWHGSRTTVNSAFTPQGGSLTAYISDHDPSDSPSVAVRSCPTFTPTQLLLSGSGVGFERSAGGYGYNNAFAGVDLGPDHQGARASWRIVEDRRGSRRDRFQTPSTTLGFADSAFADGNPAAGIIEYSFAEPRFWPGNPAGPHADPSIHFRHHTTRRSPGSADGRAQAVWLDGHVSTEARSLSTSSGLYPADPAAYGIGWFGRSDDNDLFDY